MIIIIALNFARLTLYSKTLMNLWPSPQKFSELSTDYYQVLYYRRGCSANLQVVITHVSHVCKLHSFGLPLRTNGMHITQFDHACLDLLSLESDHVCFDHLPRKSQHWRKSILTFNRYCPHSVTFGYYQLIMKKFCIPKEIKWSRKTIIMIIIILVNKINIKYKQNT